MFSFLNGQSSGSDIRSVNNLVVDTIPASARGYELNNQYQHFPPLMADGRAVIASWTPESYVDETIQKNSGIRSNWEYRKYLTDNAQEIMQRNLAEACSDVGFVANQNGWMSQQAPVQPGAALPLASDLKQLYMSQEQLETRRQAPLLTQDELLRLRGK
jgi:hypothetical protein